jgi:endogenous inhibitor of DNA gyrase (YacG/DUF329 family)
MSDPPPANANDNARAPRCPTCGKPTVAEFRPFCSKRCADVDLHRWLAGVYAVPGAAEEDAERVPEADTEPKLPR